MKLDLILYENTTLERTVSELKKYDLKMDQNDFHNVPNFKMGINVSTTNTGVEKESGVGVVYNTPRNVSRMGPLTSTGGKWPESVSSSKVNLQLLHPI
jgi:hypothetical protein